MKSLTIYSTLLLAFTLFVNAKPPDHEFPPHVIAARNVCLKKFDFTEEKFHERMRIAGDEDRELNCIKGCIGKELGILDDEGNIVKEEAVKQFPPFVPEENRTRVVDECSATKGDDDCETARLYEKCLKEHLPPPPVHPKLKMAHDNCKTKLSLTDEEIERMRQSKDELEKDCFLACIGKEVGIMAEDGRFNREMFIEKISPHLAKEDAEKIADECDKEEGADDCETAILVHRCFERNKVFESFRPGNGRR